MPTKDDLQKMVKLLKEETAKLQKVNKQRFERAVELEEKVNIQSMQLALLFETLKFDSRHSGFASLVMMLGRTKKFWDNKPMNELEEQIKEMEETGMLDFEEEDDDDDFPPFLRKRKG